MRRLSTKSSADSSPSSTSMNSPIGTMGSTSTLQGIPPSNPIQVNPLLDTVPFAPTFRPTVEEFAQPYVFIDRIRPIAQKYGICKIIPPDGWRPPCPLDFNKVRFGTKKQRIDQLMDRGDVFGEAGSSDSPHNDSQSTASESRAPVIRPAGRGRPRKNVKASPALSSPRSERVPPEIRSVDVNDAELFYSALGSWLEYEGHPTPGVRSVPFQNTNGKIDLHALYTVVTSCGGINAITDTIGWEDLLSNLGVVASESKQGIQKPVRALWGEWLASFYRRRTMKLPSITTRSKQNGNVDDDGVIELDDDGESVTPASRKRKSETLGNAAAEEPRRSKRDRKPTVSVQLSSHFVNDNSPRAPKNRSALLNGPCVACKQSDNHDQKLVCTECEEVFHSFCISPPLQSLPSNVKLWQCRDCANEGEGTWGFGTGNVHTLESYRQQANAFKRRWFKVDDSSKVDPALVASEFWRIVQSADHSNPVSVEYGSDLDSQDTGSVYPTTGEYATHPWNLNILPRLPASVMTALNNDIEGVSIPWLYIGMCFSAFCWHNEDHYSFSVNYVSVGEPKQWYGISSDDVADFETSMKAHLPSLFHASPDLLSHLTTMLAPTTLASPLVEHAPKVRVHQILQNAGEIVLTFPQAYHAGFNVGWNCSESVNFGPISFLPFGLRCLTRYRYFHRTPVWSTDEIVWKVAVSLVQTFKERKSRSKNKYNQTEQIAADRHDLDNGELSLWKRAAYVLPSLVHLCDREYNERFRLASRGTMRMKPWPDAKQAEWFQVGQRVQANVHGWRDAVVVSVLDDGTYQVKQDSDGLVKLVDQRFVRAVVSQEEVRTHVWDTFQNVGVTSSFDTPVDMEQDEDEPLSNKVPRRTGKMMAGPTPAALPQSSTPNPRCLICQHFLYLSCVHCSCTLDKAACLSHSNQLCGCADQSKYGVFRYTLSEISQLCDAVAEIVQATPKKRGQFQQPLSYQSAHPMYAAEINAIMIEAQQILASPDSHVIETHVRLTQDPNNLKLAHFKDAEDDCNKAFRQQLQFPLIAQPSPSVDLDHWRAEADDWLARYESVSEFDKKPVTKDISLKSCDIDGILSHAQQFLWGDYRSARINQAYRRLQSYQRSINFLSLQLCSIVSAHGLFKTMASQLIQACQSFDQFKDSKLLSDFMKMPLLSGCMPLSHAQELQSSLADKAGALTCHCKKISSRYQRMTEIDGVLIPGAGPFTNPAVFTPPASMMQHLTLFNSLLKNAETLADEKPLIDISNVIETPAAFSPLLTLSIQHGCNPIICPQRASIMNRAKPKLIDAIATHSAAIVEQPQIQTRRSLASSPEQLSPVAKKESPLRTSGRSATVIASSSRTSARHNRSSSPVDLTTASADIPISKSNDASTSQYTPRVRSSAAVTSFPSPVVPDRELASSLSHVHIKSETGLMTSCADLSTRHLHNQLTDTAASTLLNSLVDSCSDPDQASELLRFGQSAIRCLTHKTGEASNDPVLTAYLSSPIATLSMLVDLSKSLVRVKSSNQIKTLMLHFTHLLTDRLQAMHCWCSHAQRLMSWLVIPSPLTITLPCHCSPMLIAANKGEMPSLAFCKGNHALPQSSRVRHSGRIDRYGICCIDTLLDCPVTVNLPAIELDMIRHSRAQVNEWSTRVTDLLLTDPSRQQRATPMSYVYGLKAEGEQLPFISHAFNQFMDAFNRMIDFQRRLDASNRQAAEAIQSHARYVTHNLICLHDHQSINQSINQSSDRIDSSRWAQLEKQLIDLQAEGAKLRCHLHEMVTAKRMLKQIKANKQIDAMTD